MKPTVKCGKGYAGLSLFRSRVRNAVAKGHGDIQKELLREQFTECPREGLACVACVSGDWSVERMWGRGLGAQ